MFYNFPSIFTIEDVLPHIKDNPNFNVMEKDGYTVINYYMLGNETFPDITSHAAMVMRECRGIAFDKTGNIISRPFHKFFNHGERVETTGITKCPAHVLQKLDGSMIRPLYFGEQYRLGTKAGITDISMMAENYAAGLPKYKNFIDYCRMNSATPIFEYVSRNNRIVLDYPEEDLILLAVRHMMTGEYWSREDLVECSFSFCIPLVDTVNLWSWDNTTPEMVASSAKALEGEEGYVMVFDDGHMLKAKAEWYVTLHRAKDIVSREREVIRLILQAGLDDVIPLLQHEDKVAVRDFEETFNFGLLYTVRAIENAYKEISKDLLNEGDARLKRKEIALRILKLYPQYKSFLFGMYDGKDVREIVKETILHNLGSRASLDSVRWIFGNAKYNGWSDNG